MVRALVLGTYTIFNYDPSDDEAKQLYARVRKVAVASLEGKDLPVQDSKEMKARLRAAEKKLLNIHRHCKGDASETGLVQFAESVMPLEATRAKYPTHKYKRTTRRLSASFHSAPTSSSMLSLETWAPTVAVSPCT